MKKSKLQVYYIFNSVHINVILIKTRAHFQGNEMSSFHMDISEQVTCLHGEKKLYHINIKFYNSKDELERGRSTI